MFIKTRKSGYTRDGQQFAHGLFLLLVSPKESAPIGTNNVRAIVRFVRLTQFGHWMMGSAWIGGKRIAVSGAYGNDGLTCDVDDDIYNQAVPLPDDLYQAWNKGGGWNSSGSEGPAMREWTLENLDHLYQVKR